MWRRVGATVCDGVRRCVMVCGRVQRGGDAVRQCVAGRRRGGVRRGVGVAGCDRV